MEIKTYCFLMSTEEIFDALENKKLDKLMDMIKETKGFVGVHPSADGSSTLFLFLTPQARYECLTKAVDLGFKADLVLNPCFVDAEDIK